MGNSFFSIKNKPKVGSKIKNALITKNLMGYWVFNEGGGLVLHDVYKNRYHGEIRNTSGAPAVSGWTVDQYGKSLALEFDDINEYILLSQMNKILGMTQCTLCAWVYKKANNQDHILFSHRNSITDENLILFWINDVVPAGQYGAGNENTLSATFGSYGNVGNIINGTNNACSENKLYFLCVVFNKEYRALYIDGKLNANHSLGVWKSYTRTVSPVLGNWINTIFANINYHSFYMYDRALTAGEISFLYKNQYAHFLKEENIFKTLVFPKHKTYTISEQQDNHSAIVYKNIHAISEQQDNHSAIVYEDIYILKKLNDNYTITPIKE